MRKSDVGFDNCVGCTDGILIWTNKPTENILHNFKLTGKLFIGAKKCFCGRKKRFGLNVQAIYDDKRQFIDIETSHPASKSDYLVFVTSSIV